MIIGVTGAISSGKTTFCQYFKKIHQNYSAKSITIIDCDQVVHQLYQPKQTGWLAIKENFGTSFIQENHQINRQKLRSYLSENPQYFPLINDLIHPLVNQKIQQLIPAPSSKDICLIEAINFRQIQVPIDLMILINTPYLKIIEIAENRQLNPQELKILFNQFSAPTGEFQQINNNQDLKSYHQKIQKMYKTTFHSTTQ